MDTLSSNQFTQAVHHLGAGLHNIAQVNPSNS